MGQKINATGLRLGVNKDWQASWITPKVGGFAKAIGTDLKIRKLLNKVFKTAGIDRIIIDRTSGEVEVTVFVAKPGIAIGREGTLIEEVKGQLKRLIGGNPKLNIKEVQNPSLSARVIAREIADSIEKRRPEKMLMNKAVQRVRKAGAKGVRIEVRGRIRGSKYHNVLVEVSGRVPRQTLRADIDYAYERAKVVNVGILSVKVWIYKGDKHEK